MRISDWSSDVCSSDLPPAPSRKHLHKCVNGYACPIGSPKLCSFLIRPDPQWRHQSDFASLASDGDTRSAWQCACECASIGIEIAQEIELSPCPDRQSSAGVYGSFDITKDKDRKSVESGKRE